MKRLVLTAGLLAGAIVSLPANRAQAFFHLWTFTEFFSNADGSVQFIELRNTSNNEHFAAGAEIRSQSTGKVFTFPGNLSSSLTANRNLLIATSGFGSLPGGVGPDYVLPSTSFFNPAGDTITLWAGSPINTRTFPSVPTDGVMSRVYPSNTLATNTPTNFAGTTGSVNLPPPVTPSGDYNGNDSVDAADFVVWRDTFGQSITAGQGADGNANGTIEDDDYNFWRARFGNSVPGASLGAVPEPAAAMLMSIGLALVGLHRRR